MLDQLLQLVRDNAQEAIVGNSAIPNDKNESAISETAQSIIESLKGEYNKGNIGGLMGLLNGGTSQLASNPIIGNMVASVAENLAQKVGIDPAQARSAAEKLIPQVAGQLINRLNDPNDKEFDLQNLLKEFGAGGMGSMLGGMLGGGLGKLFG